MKNLQKPEKNPKLVGSEAVGVQDFLSEIKKQRRKRNVDKDFAEDEVLEIVNHKSRWKKTLSKRVQRLLKCKVLDDQNLRMN